MPQQQVWGRIISLRAKELAHRKKAVQNMRKKVMQRYAFRNVEVAPALGAAGLSNGHTCFALVPIVFCKVCGGIRSTAGNLLKKACRGWAPKGARSLFNAMMKGSQAYRARATGYRWDKIGNLRSQGRMHIFEKYPRSLEIRLRSYSIRRMLQESSGFLKKV